MPKVLVLFYSRTGTTARLADALVEGARSVKFTEVDVRRIDDLAPAEAIERVPGWAASRASLAQRYRTFEGVDHLEHYDAVVLGAPTLHGAMAAELKHVVDQTGPLRDRGALVDRVGSAFTAVSAGHAGHETALWSIMATMATLGMILCPPGYSDPATSSGGSPYGATAVTGTPGEADLAAARHQGKRVATVTGWVHHAKGHAAHAHSHAHPHSH